MALLPSARRMNVEVVQLILGPGVVGGRGGQAVSAQGTEGVIHLRIRGYDHDDNHTDT
jgi:hypothetical protein